MKFVRNSTAKKLDALLKREQGRVVSSPPETLDRESGPNWQFVRVTGEYVEDVYNYGYDASDEDYAGDRRYYPGRVIVWDSRQESWTELGACWVIDVNDDDLESGRIYKARQSGDRDVNSSELPVFLTQSSAIPTTELPEVDNYEGYGDDYYGDGCELTESVVIDYTVCVNGQEVTRRLTLDFPFFVRACVEDV